MAYPNTYLNYEMLLTSYGSFDYHQEPGMRLSMLYFELRLTFLQDHAGVHLHKLEIHLLIFEAYIWGPFFAVRIIGSFIEVLLSPNRNNNGQWPTYIPDEL